MTEKERFLRQRQTYASRAQRNRSLFAIYQKKIEDEEKKKNNDKSRHYDLWDTRKHVAFKRKKNYTVISDETKVSK